MSEGIGAISMETSGVWEERLQKVMPLMFGNSNCAKGKAELDRDYKAEV